MATKEGLLEGFRLKTCPEVEDIGQRVFYVLTDEKVNPPVADRKENLPVTDRTERAVASLMHNLHGKAILSIEDIDEILLGAVGAPQDLQG